jgi:hypothetical protein
MAGLSVRGSVTVPQGYRRIRIDQTPVRPSERMRGAPARLLDRAIGVVKSIERGYAAKSA